MDNTIYSSSSITLSGITFSLSVHISPEALTNLDVDSTSVHTADELESLAIPLFPDMHQSLYAIAQLFRLNLLDAYVNSKEQEYKNSVADNTRDQKDND